MCDVRRNQKWKFTCFQNVVSQVLFGMKYSIDLGLLLCFRGTFILCYIASFLSPRRGRE